ncbi:MAG TPA: hypothetical protein VIJ62_07125 [Rhizomicrobium sp.]
MNEQLLDEQWNIDFSVAKSMRYHAYRRSFWEMLDNWTKCLVVFSGTAVLVSIVGEKTFLAQLFAFVVAFLSAIDVVLGFSSRARTHDSLYKQFCRLQSEISKVTQPTEANIAAWRSSRLEIELEEPTTLDWLERRSAFEEAKSRGVEIRPGWVLKPWQILLSQFAVWPQIKFPVVTKQ